MMDYVVVLSGRRRMEQQEKVRGVFCEKITGKSGNSERIFVNVFSYNISNFAIINPINYL